MKLGLAVAGALLAIVVLSVAAWQLGWFVAEKNVNRRTEVNNRSLARQQGLTTKVLSDYATVTDIDAQDQTPQVVAQRKAVLTRMCATSAQLTGSITLSPGVETFIAQECP